MRPLVYEKKYYLYSAEAWHHLYHCKNNTCSMELYHGSNTVVSKPQIIQGRYTKDFGPGYFDNVAAARYAIPTHWDIGKVYHRLILDVANTTGSDVIDTMMAVYNSWISRKIDNYNSSMYYENPSYLLESYKAGAVLA